MNANTKTTQLHQDNERNAKVAYEAPALTVMGTVEHLTALLDRGVPDLVSHGNIL